jgi:hypothetical protein
MARSVGAPFRDTWLPPSILTGVLSVARTLRRQLVTDDLLLIALADPESPSVGGPALRAEGATFASLMSASSRQPPREAEIVTFHPLVSQLVAWAYGFAVGTGSSSASADDLLVALLWHAESASSRLLREMGVERSKVLSRMRALGVRTPEAEVPPAKAAVDFGDSVWFPATELAAVLAYLRQHMPRFETLRFNTSGDRAWVAAAKDVPLKDLVGRATQPDDSGVPST